MLIYLFSKYIVALELRRRGSCPVISLHVFLSFCVQECHLEGTGSSGGKWPLHLSNMSISTSKEQFQSLGILWVECDLIVMSFHIT